MNHNSPFTRIPHNEQALFHLRQMFERADGLTILGWPIVINPVVRKAHSVVLGVDSAMNFTGSNEIHMTQETFSTMAIPAELALVEATVAEIQSKLVNYYVVMELAGQKHYASVTGQATGKEQAFLTNRPGRAEQFCKDLNARESAGVTWAVESELWKEANRA